MADGGDDRLLMRLKAHGGALPFDALRNHELRKLGALKRKRLINYDGAQVTLLALGAQRVAPKFEDIHKTIKQKRQERRAARMREHFARLKKLAVLLPIVALLLCCLAVEE